VGPVIEAGKVKVIGFPSDSVRVVTLDAEADREGLTVNVCRFVVTVVGPVIEAGKVKVTGFPSDPVRVVTFDADADRAGLTVNVCLLVVTVVGPVTEAGKHSEWHDLVLMRENKLHNDLDCGIYTQQYKAVCRPR